MTEELDIEELKRMLRHLHNDTENCLRKLDILQHKIIAIACLVQSASKGEVDEKELDAAINLDPEYYSSLDEMYSPIDETDRVAWIEHIKREMQQDKESEE